VLEACPWSGFLTPRQTQETAAYLTQHEAALVVDSVGQGLESRLERSLVRLSADRLLRAKLARNSAAVIDGGGAGRIAQKLIELLPR